MEAGRRMKMAARIAAAGMVMAAALPVTAAGNDTITVGYTEDSTFTLQIPSSVTLKEDAGVSATVGLSAINVGVKEKVQIKVKSGISNGAVTLTDEKDGTNTVSSMVSLAAGAAAGIGDNAVVAEFEGTDTTAKTGGTLYFSQLGDVPAGNYSGTIVFEAAIVEKN